jgi:hypothetical protein
MDDPMYNDSTEIGWDIRLIDRKLTDDETEHVKDIVYSVLQQQQGQKDDLDGSESSSLIKSIMEEDDIADIAAYCAAMISNEKSINYVIDEIAVFFTNTTTDESITPSTTTTTTPIQTILGNQLQQYVLSLLNETNSNNNDNRNNKDDTKQKSEDDTKSISTGNALTMSGALGASRERKSTKQDTVMHNKGKSATTTTTPNQNNNNNSRQSKAFERLTSVTNSTGGRGAIGDGGRGRGGNQRTSTPSGRGAGDGRGGSGGRGSSNRNNNHPSNQNYNNQMDQQNGGGRGRFGRGTDHISRSNNTNLRGSDVGRFDGRGGRNVGPRDMNHGNDSHRNQGPRNDPRGGGGRGDIRGGRNIRNDGPRSDPHSNSGGRSGPIPMQQRIPNNPNHDGPYDAPSHHHDLVPHRGAGPPNGGRIPLVGRTPGGRFGGRPPIPPHTTPFLSGQRRGRDSDDHNNNHTPPTSALGGRNSNTPGRNHVSGGRGIPGFDGRGGGRKVGRTMEGGRFGGRNLENGAPGRGRGDNNSGPNPKRIRYDATNPPPPVEEQGYDPNEGSGYTEEYDYGNEEYFDDGSGYYDVGYDESYNYNYHHQPPGGRGFFSPYTGGRGRFYRGRGFGRSNYIAPGGRYSAGRGFPPSGIVDPNETVTAAATAVGTEVDATSAAAVAAHPSPLVAATYRGRGGYAFVRGGDGRGRFPTGRGSYAGRVDVKTMIASKTWVRNKPVDETNADKSDEVKTDENVTE